MLLLGVRHLALPLALLAACGDEGEPTAGVVPPCETPFGGLVGCVPPASDPAPTIESACQRMVDCGIFALNYQPDPANPDYHQNDFTACVNRLRGDEYSDDRLTFTLRCIEVSTCQDLSAGFDNPCFVFGGEPPAP